MENVLLSNNFSHSQKKVSAARKMVSRVHDSFFFTWTSIKGHKAPIARKHFSRKRSRFTHLLLPQQRKKGHQTMYHFYGGK